MPEAGAQVSQGGSQTVTPFICVMGLLNHFVPGLHNNGTKSCCCGIIQASEYHCHSKEARGAKGLTFWFSFLQVAAQGLEPVINAAYELETRWCLAPRYPGRARRAQGCENLGLMGCLIGVMKNTATNQRAKIRCHAEQSGRCVRVFMGEP
jgi:hypothetical protein